ncbi:MAG: polysaccharide pyruvyl transferase [Planctomycetes bacterium GWF2_41_51]|nr:MAG: polysaccharide pyruvyl transferase [Planctomycetes bacterium GWF2_41_51]
MTEKNYKVGITGSYGGMNLGDESILETIIDRLRETIPAINITVFSKNPADTLQRQRVDNSIAIRDLVRKEAVDEIKKLDLLIFGGGGIIYDRDIKIYLREVEIANEVGVPVVVYAISGGPLNDPENRKLVVKHLNLAAAITVRDRQSMKLLEEVGVKKKIILTADPALLLQPSPISEDLIKREGLDQQHRKIGFSVREPGPAAPDLDIEHYHTLLANTADFMVARLDADIFFVPLEQKVHDSQQSHRVISRMRHANRATVLKGEYTSSQLLTLIKHFDFCVGMRLHFLIFSAVQGVPFAALPYASKIHGFLQELDIPAPPLKEITAGDLIAYIDKLWDMQGKIKEKIALKIEELQNRARMTNDIVIDVLKNPSKYAK